MLSRFGEALIVSTSRVQTLGQIPLAYCLLQFCCLDRPVPRGTLPGSPQERFGGPQRRVRQTSVSRVMLGLYLGGS